MTNKEIITQAAELYKQGMAFYNKYKSTKKERKILTLFTKAVSCRNRKEAELYYRRILKLDANDSANYSNLGGCLYHQGRFTEAESYFLRAIELNPNDNNYQDMLNECFKAQEKLTS